MDDHLEMTWSSLVQTKQELDSMKDLRQEFHKVQGVNQKMSDSVAYCRAEVRDLSLAVKNLKAENIQLKKFVDDLTKKTAREIKGLESKMLRHTQMGGYEVPKRDQVYTATIRSANDLLHKAPGATPRPQRGQVPIRYLTPLLKEKDDVITDQAKG